MSRFEGKSVLAVDDEQGYRDMYVFVLEPMGIQVTCAQDGQEAVQKVQERAYDLIFMDEHMPRMEGHDAVKKIKAIYPDQKIIIFSSVSDGNFLREKELLEASHIECLYKPMELDEIERALNRVFEGGWK